MRQLIAFGLLAAAFATIAGCGGLFLIATLLMAGPDSSSYSAGYAPYVGGYQRPVYVEPQYGGPAGGWQSGHEWNGRLSSGTSDPTRQGNDVISVDGQVLTLPN